MAGLVPWSRKNTNLTTGFDDFYSMLDDFFGDNWLSARSLSRGSFRVDVQEREKEYVVEADLPGVKKEEIGIELNDGRLSIGVNREETVDEKNNNYVHRERRVASTCRSLYLADAAEEGIKAKLDNGVLNIVVPKQARPNTSRRIEIE